MTPSPRQLERQSPQRRSASRGGGRRGRGRWIALAVVVVGILLAVAALARLLAPTGNTDAARLDAIIVLGTPSDDDGNPTPEQLARVSEGVKEYERGVAPRLIFSGAAAHNQFVEAESMARVARAQGVPDSAIVLEPQAKDTIQNACYSARIMRQHGWRSAEVVTSKYHLPRAGLIFSRLPPELHLEWRGHAAPSLGPESAPDWAFAASEVAKTTRYLIYARWTDSCAP